jgi:hypothetical protein
VHTFSREFRDCRSEILREFLRLKAPEVDHGEKMFIELITCETGGLSPKQPYEITAEGLVTKISGRI